jgi:guanylate kinase
MEALITITGPSCSGKTTLQNWLYSLQKFNRIISFTTRTKRPNETEGEDYYFKTKDEIDKLREAGEVAEFVAFGDHYYGILGAELKRKLAVKRTVAVVEPNGVVQLNSYCRENSLRHFAIYLTNPPIVTTGRFLKRLQADPSPLLLDYAKRIINMNTEEQSWIYKFPYNLVFTSYDSTNEQEVERQVFDALNRL